MTREAQEGRIRGGRGRERVRARRFGQGELGLRGGRDCFDERGMVSGIQPMERR